MLLGHRLLLMDLVRAVSFLNHNFPGYLSHNHKKTAHTSRHFCRCAVFAWAVIRSHYLAEINDVLLSSEGAYQGLYPQALYLLVSPTTTEPKC